MKKPRSRGKDSVAGTELGATGRPSEGSGARVLLAVAAKGAGEELERDLAASGYRVTRVRNRYAAIDALRAERHDMVASDLELWEDGGDLLFERMRRRGEILPVVFLGGSMADLARRPGEGETVRCIPPPFTGGDLCAVARAVLRSERRSAPEAGAPRPPGGEGSPLGVGRPSRERGSGSGGRAPAELDVDPAPRWRRFFSVAPCRLDAREDRAERLGELVACFREVVQPLAAMVAISSPMGYRLILDAPGPAGESRNGADPVPWGELFEALLEGEASPDSLRITLPAGSSRTLSFLARLRDGEAARLDDGPFLEGLRSLLAEALRGGDR